MRKYIVISWLAVIFMLIAVLFWQHEWRYNLPTPLPDNYKPVNTGTFISTSKWVKHDDDKPVFFHFFNPDCPCSRFNINHFKTLIKKYQKQLNFFVVVISKTNYTSEDIRKKYDLSVPVLFDRSIATACGVYSTPQAAIIGDNSRLYYRGNYNKNRYCTDANSNYAEQAIDSLLAKNMNPLFTMAATKSYGCSLALCTK